jgi:hypothetical protein
MEDQDVTIPNVWKALDGWAVQLRPWQRRILALATRGGILTSAQTNEVHELFLAECKLGEPQSPRDVALDISGRPPETLTKRLHLQRVDGLCGVNALPDGSALTFAPGLTVIYGRNGAGKTGFARLVANVCFSRHKPAILSDIYTDSGQKPIAATFHILLDGEPQEPLALSSDTEHAELRRISFFDATVARLRVSEAAAFEFKPSGFDVFPEMVRVYGEIGQRLDLEILGRTHDTKFSDSFIGEDTPVSKAVAAISAATDIEALRALSRYGLTETARLAEIDAQLVALKSGSSKEALATLVQARGDIDALAVKLKLLGEAFTSDKALSRNELCKKAKDSAEDATKLGINQFKRAFFNAVGSPEWQAFSNTAHSLARKESVSYPSADDRCLLCEQLLDSKSREHIVALLSFVEDDVQRRVASASEAVEAEITTLVELNIEPFSAESRVHEHVHRLDPAVESTVVDAVATIHVLRERTIEALHSLNLMDGSVSLEDASRRQPADQRRHRHNAPPEGGRDCFDCGT